VQCATFFAGQFKNATNQNGCAAGGPYWTPLSITKVLKLLSG